LDLPGKIIVSKDFLRYLPASVDHPKMDK